MSLPYDDLNSWVTNLKTIRGFCAKRNPDAGNESLNSFAKKKISDLLQNNAFVQFECDVEGPYPDVGLIDPAYTFAELTEHVSNPVLRSAVESFVQTTCNASCIGGDGRIDSTKPLTVAYPQGAQDIGWITLNVGIHSAGLMEVIEPIPNTVVSKLEAIRSAVPPKLLSDLLVYLRTIH